MPTRAQRESLHPIMLRVLRIWNEYGAAKQMLGDVPEREAFKQWNEALPPGLEPSQEATRCINVLVRRHIGPQEALALWETGFLPREGIGAKSEAWFAALAPRLRTSQEQSDSEYRDVIEFAFGAV